jgi:hypothetical protein
VFSVSEFGKAVCGSSIGSSGKVCLKRGCQVKLHLKKIAPKIQSLIDEGVENVVLVVSGGKEEASIPPILDALLVDDATLEDWKSLSKPPTEWAKILSVAGAMEQGDLENLALTDWGPLSTPKKPPLVKSLDASVFQGVAVPTIEAFKADDKKAFQQLLSATKGLESALGSVVPSMMTDLIGHLELLNMNVRKTNMITGVIGEPSSTNEEATLWGAVSATAATFSQLEQIYKKQQLQIDSQKQELASHKLETATAVAAAKAEVVQKVTEDVVDGLAGSTVGTTIAQANVFLRDEAPALIRMKNAQGTASSFGASSAASPPEVSRTDWDTLIARLDSMELRAKRDREDFDLLPPVVVCGIRFTSVECCEIWLKANNAVPFALHFLDLVSLCQVATVDAATPEELVDKEHKTEKAGLTDPTFAVVFHSFSLTLPFALGSSAAKTKASAHTLPAFPTYESFAGTGAELDGGAKMLKQAVEDKMSPLQDSISETGMSAKAETLGLRLLANTQTHLDKLLTFMQEEYGRQGASSTLLAARKWEVVTKLIRILFNAVKKVRSGPAMASIKTVTAPRVAARILWATLQAHRVLDEFVAKGFRLHPDISPVLTSHLLEICAFREDIDKLRNAQETALKRMAADGHMVVLPVRSL